MILGLASNQDSTISHAAIMARSMGLPAVLQLVTARAALAAGNGPFWTPTWRTAPAA